MYNYFMIFGILQSEPVLIDLGEGKKVMNLLIGVQRPFKNIDGEYLYDTVKLSLWDFMAEYAAGVFKKGKQVGIKGRMSPIEVDLGDGKKAIYHNLVGERVVFYEYGTPKEFPANKETDEES